MPRTVEINVSTERSDELLAQLAGLEGVLSLRAQRGAFIQPPGDLVVASVLDETLPALVDRLMDSGIGVDEGSITTSVPLGMIDSSRPEQVVRDRSEAGWEEMELLIGRESNMTVNSLLVMVASGVLATAGLATDALHLVVAAMLIAPGFVPITRIALGAVAGSGGWRHGAIDTIKGYMVLVAAASATAAVLAATGNHPTGSGSAYFAPSTLVSYWTTVDVPALLVVVIAGGAGAVLIASNRSVLTAGVMVAVALVPSAAIAGIALVAVDPQLLLAGAGRWLVEAALIAVMGAIVFAWKRSSVHRRRAVRTLL